MRVVIQTVAALLLSSVVFAQGTLPKRMVDAEPINIQFTNAPASNVLTFVAGAVGVTLMPGGQQVGEDEAGTPDNFANYFVVQFDQPFKSVGTWTPDATNKGQDSQEGDHVGAYLEFDTAADRIITYRVASSYISEEQAELTLAQEIGGNSFDEVREKGLAMRGVTWVRSKLPTADPVTPV